MSEFKKISVENFDGKPEFDPISLYNWRISWLKDAIKNHIKIGNIVTDKQKAKWYKEEKQTLRNNQKDFAKIKKLQGKIGVIVPSHVNSVKFLRACLESCQDIGFIILAYDNPFHSQSLSVEKRMPSSRALMLADMVIMKHKTWASGVGVPHVWNVFYAIKQLQSLGFEYIFNLNGDCILEKPEKFPEMVEMLGDADIISSEFYPERKYLGSMCWLAKIEPMVKFWENYVQKLYHFNIGNCEARLGRFYMENGYKIVSVENSWEPQMKPHLEKEQIGTFYKTFGLRHLHAEHKVRRALRMEPVEEKYFDKGENNIFLSGFEQQTLLKYWETKDRTFLEKWWGK